MAIKGQALTICFLAFNTDTQAGQIDDEGNIALRIVADGVKATPSGAITPVDDTECPGLYKVTLTAGEMDADSVAVHGVSSTSNVIIIPLVIVTESGALATIQTDLDNPNQYKADVSGLATAAALAAAQADLDDPDQYKADVSSLATSAELATHDGKLDTVDGNIDTLLTRVTGIVATAVALAAHDGKLDVVDANMDTLLTRITEAVAHDVDMATLLSRITEAVAHDADITTLLTRVAEAVATAAGLAAHDAKFDAVDANVDTLVGVCTEARLARLDTAVSTRATLGTGAKAFPYTLTSTVDGSPIADADVWVTTDAAGNNVVASGRTDAYGKVTFRLDPGTIYVWRQKSGWDFPNPDTEVVS